VRAFSLHPGGIAGTGLEKYVSRKELRAGGIVDENGKPIFEPGRGLKTVEQGAATGVWCVMWKECPPRSLAQEPFNESTLL
jgi:hypothetical protein